MICTWRQYRDLLCAIPNHAFPPMGMITRSVIRKYFKIKEIILTCTQCHGITIAHGDTQHKPNCMYFEWWKK